MAAALLQSETMVAVRAEEHRYIISASGREGALTLRIPGCREVPALRGFQLPRQPGTILALDELFGVGAWEHSPDLAQEIVEARQRQHAQPQHRASVRLDGTELAIECAFADKELVKLVSGYRWSAPRRTWFVPAYPMALEMLEKYFGEMLDVEPGAREYLRLKRIDEDRALERATSAVEPTPAPPPIPVVEPPTQPAPARAETSAGVPEGLYERLDRLAGAVEALVAALQNGAPVARAASEAPGTEAEPTLTLATAEPQTPAGDGSWRDLLNDTMRDPAEVLQRLRTPLEQAAPAELPTVRAIAGIASSLQGDHREALTYIRRARDSAQVALDTELEQRTNKAYLDSVVALIGASTRPERPVADAAGIAELVLAELAHDSGFVDEGLGSKDSRDLLSLLMDDQLLRRVDPVLTDYCRVLHLVGVARGGRWMAADRVVEMLKHRDLTHVGFALGLIVLANTVFEQPCVEEWFGRWPRNTPEPGFDDLRAIVESAATRLREVEPTIAAAAALSVLALVSGVRTEVASLEERRTLVRYIPPNAPERRYAEFLAAYQPAEAGARKVWQTFPGYLQILAQSPLAQSAQHLLTVFVNDSGGADSTTRRIAEEVYLNAFITRGVRDPRVEVLELVDMLAESPRADNLLNDISGRVEEGDPPGLSVFSHEQRVELFTRAFRISLDAGHDHDSVASFDRCVREHLRHGEFEALRNLCLSVPQGFKPLQLPVGQALLSLQLESGEDFEPAAELVLRNCNPKTLDDEGVLELRGLGIAFPRFREYLQAHLPEEGTGEDGVEPDFSGRKMVVVGGHDWLRKRAMPVFDRWGVKATWLSPDEAKNGSQALDLANGAADLIVINTACISHAASGRVRAEAKHLEDAGTKKVAFHNSRGLGALLAISRHALADTAPPLTPAKPSSASKRRRLLR